MKVADLIRHEGEELPQFVVEFFAELCKLPEPHQWKLVHVVSICILNSLLHGTNLTEEIEKETITGKEIAISTIPENPPEKELYVFNRLLSEFLEVYSEVTIVFL